MLREIHRGICSHHAASRSYVGKAFRQGFYQPIKVTDMQHIVCTCEGCQYYTRQTDLPVQELQIIPIMWPFAVWGLDMVGSFRKVPGGYNHLLFAVDKFNKWIEA